MLTGELDEAAVEVESCDDWLIADESAMKYRKRCESSSAKSLACNWLTTCPIGDRDKFR
jgi:hypothetical protein